MESKVHVIRGKKTSHSAARAIAEELDKPVRYWPYWPSSPASFVVYPPKRKPRIS
jgi:hypothetical protein